MMATKWIFKDEFRPTFYHSNKTCLLIKKGVWLASVQPLGKRITRDSDADWRLRFAFLTGSGVMLMLLVNGSHLEHIHCSILLLHFALFHSMEWLYNCQYFIVLVGAVYTSSLFLSLSNLSANVLLPSSSLHRILGNKLDSQVGHQCLFPTSLSKWNEMKWNETHHDIERQKELQTSWLIISLHKLGKGTNK